MMLVGNTPLVLATHNAHKAAEIIAAIGHVFTAITHAGALGLPEPEETGTTFEENALLKAQAAAKAANMLALADDSGLSLPALNGFPGVYTKDFVTEYGGDYAAAYAELYRRAGQDTPAEASCFFVLAWPNGDAHVICSVIKGVFIGTPRGINGFGFDPFFYVPELGKTFGELTREEKNLHSHRGGAIRQLLTLAA